MPYSYCRTATNPESESPRPCCPLGSHGIAWGWTTPLQGRQLSLRPLWPRGVHGAIQIDQPDGQIVLRPAGLDQRLASVTEELLGDARMALPEIVTDWAACLIDAGRLRVVPTATGAEVTAHPGDPQWRRTVDVQVPWRELTGDQDPRDTFVCHEEQGSVALLGGRGAQYRVDLARVMWPGAFKGA